MANKFFLTARETAMMLGISMSTLYKMTSGNKIPYYKPGGKVVLFKESEVNDWVSRSRVATGEELQHRAELYIKKGGRV